jgi:aminopeptidase N
MNGPLSISDAASIATAFLRRQRPAQRRAHPGGALVAALALLVLGACAGPERAFDSETFDLDPRLEGSLGLGDPYFPGAGNGGYDVQHYDLALRVDVPRGSIEAEALVRAVATQDLRVLHLDLFGLEVEGVWVDGLEAGFLHHEGELRIQTAQLLKSGAEFEVRVAYAGRPEVVPDRAAAAMGLAGVGWMNRDSGSYVLSECIGAAGWFPCNNHPSDKATYRMKVSVPHRYVVAANGLLEREYRDKVWRTFEWAMNDPMATYLATVNISEFEVRVEEDPSGIPLRLYYPRDATEAELAAFERTSEMLAHFTECFGPYPFESFGAVLAYENFGGALETQALPVYSRGAKEGVVAHEMAHMWFGDSVSPRDWRDLWLNEGFAVYAGWLWSAHDKGPEALEQRARGAYRMARRAGIGAPYDPGVDHLFGGEVYVRGALALDALRRELGQDTLFEILRAWAREYAGGCASTADFIALVERISGRELDVLFDAWVYGATLPDVAEYIGDGEEE